MSAGSGSGRLVLYHGAGFEAFALHDALAAESIELRQLSGAFSGLAHDDVPAVLVVDDSLAAAQPDLPRAVAALPESVTVIAACAAAEKAAEQNDRLVLSLPDGDPARVLRTLRMGFRHSAARIAAARADRELARTRTELRQLNRIGMALMTERDPDALLVQILDRACELTGSDAGSLYLVEHPKDGAADTLRFKLTRNDSLPDLPFVEFTLPLDRTSLAGYAAATREPLVLNDAYVIPDGAPYKQNRSFDERFGYRTKSMLVVPMLDHQGVVVGVLQLINRKDDAGATITSEEDASLHVLPYTARELELVLGLAGQAAVSIENSALYQRIQEIFSSFVKAAVIAIDQRDPTTAGHSVRVATLTADLADALRLHRAGRWAGTTFTRQQMRELRYAALLHDFGKVGVREEVLVKPKKLPAYLWERVDARFHLIRRTFEVEMLRQKTGLLETHGPGGAAALIAGIENEYDARLAELNRFEEAIRAANEPRVLPEESEAILDVIAGRRFTGPDGQPHPFITGEELHFLSIPKGSLDNRERREIESHVTQTYTFLAQIPWTDDLRDVAHIAYGHHEKLDGSGYPRGVTGDDIPVQTRLMTIADIFDALTASDRPYKRALPVDRALDIISAEAGRGALDTDLVKLLLESKAYEKVLEVDWKNL